MCVCVWRSGGWGGTRLYNRGDDELHSQQTTQKATLTETKRGKPCVGGGGGGTLCV